MSIKRKQIVVLSLVLMIIVAGYVQYSYNKMSSSETAAKKDIGDAVYVQNTTSSTSTESTPGNKKDTDKNTGADNSKQASTNTSPKATTSGFFDQSKLERESAREKDIEQLNAILDDANSDSVSKQKANEKKIELTSFSQKEMNIETVLTEKGYADAYALFSDSGDVEIIVEAKSLDEKQVREITDVAVRHGDVTPSKVVIKNVY